MRQLTRPARSQLEHDLDLFVPVIVHGFDDPDPGIRDLASQLHHLIKDRRDREIPTEGREP